MVYGHSSPKHYGYDHFASELGLLYIITIAKLELEIFEEMTRREPKVRLAERDDVRRDMESGASVSSHLGFPRGNPHMYDRVEEANHRGIAGDRSIGPRGRRATAQDLSDDEILYYRNPPSPHCRTPLSQGRADGLLVHLPMAPLGCRPTPAVAADGRVSGEPFQQVPGDGASHRCLRFRNPSGRSFA